MCKFLLVWPQLLEDFRPFWRQRAKSFLWTFLLVTNLNKTVMTPKNSYCINKSVNLVTGCSILDMNSLPPPPTNKANTTAGFPAICNPYNTFEDILLSPWSFSLDKDNLLRKHLMLVYQSLWRDHWNASRFMALKLL